MDPEQTDDSALLARITDLESRQRRLQRAGWLTMISLLLAVMAAALHVRQDRHALDTRELVLRDAQGNVRSRFAVQEETGTASLQLLDLQGRTTASLEASDAGSRSLRFYDPDGKLQAQLIADHAGPGLTLYHDGGKPRLWVGVLGQSPSVELIDSIGSPRAKLAMIGGNPVLSLTESSGKRREKRVASAQTPDTASSGSETRPLSVKLDESSRGAERRYPPGTLGG